MHEGSTFARPWAKQVGLPVGRRKYKTLNEREVKKGIYGEGEP